MLDLQSAFDRGSKPLLQSSDFDILPLNLDDSEMSLGSTPTADVTQEGRWTEMSPSSIIYKAGICQRYLTEASLSMSPKTSGQQTVLEEFEFHLNCLKALCSAQSSPIQSFTMAIGQESLVAMRLLLYRPLHHHTRTPAIPPALNILQTATEVLERNEMKRTKQEFVQWAWFGWPKWYALAIVLAELCTARGPEADRAWEIARRSYDDYAQLVADARSGLLWKPIAKLMRQVKTIREAQPAKPNDTFGQDFFYIREDGSAQLLPHNESSAASMELSIDAFDNSLPHDSDLPSHYMLEIEDLSWLTWNDLMEDINSGDF